MVLYGYQCVVFYRCYALAGYNSINYVLFISFLFEKNGINDE
jgi:hypothetical protein